MSGALRWPSYPGRILVSSIKLDIFFRLEAPLTLGGCLYDVLICMKLPNIISQSVICEFYAIFNQTVYIYPAEGRAVHFFMESLPCKRRR